MISRRFLATALLSGIAGTALCAAAQTVELPRKTSTNAPREQVPRADVIYDSVRTRAGYRLRRITTIPQNTTGKLPTLFMVGWLSCDSVEQPGMRSDGFAELMYEIASRSGFITVRIDKPGVGDSEGPACAHADFQTELAAYQDAFDALSAMDRVDTSKIFIIGFSNGGGFAPLVARDRPVRGYLVFSGWVKTWFEHMMEHERRRLARAGESPGEINRKMRLYSQFYDLYLNQKLTPVQAIERNPALKEIWYDKPESQYGRPAAYYQQLQELNLAEAWSKVSVPVLAVHGDDDWIMSADDYDLLVNILNAKHPGLAQSVHFARTDHVLMLAGSKGMNADLIDPAIPKLALDWLAQHK